MVQTLKKLDWLLIGALAPLFAWSLLTLKNLGGDAGDYFFIRQVFWIAIGLSAMLILSFVDWRIFSHSGIIIVLYFINLIFLSLLFLGGATVHGATSWFRFSIASFQPTELVKLILIIMLAKYFSGRHIEIARVRHIFISGLYAAIPIGLVLLQPDLGSSVVIGAIWFGMTLVSGIKPKHLLVVVGLTITAAVVSWFFLFVPYQKTRILTFLNPSFDPQGAGYNAIQSMIAVGSGQIWGKGVGFGSQSRLNFLPESHTDFIFAAFAEEWGLVGIGLFFLFFGVLIWRILYIGLHSPENFTKLFSIGLSIFIVFQSMIHIGMNMGMLPITGVSLPFMSYGGSGLLMILAGLGIVQSIYVHDRTYAMSGTRDPLEGSFL